MKQSPEQIKKDDLTGQDRFAWNLVVSWTSQLVLIFSGFIMPRLVDDKVGQVALGVWDFGWSFVSYLSLVSFGMGACFNRYIAKHRAAGETKLLNKVANSTIFVQLTLSIVAISFTVIFYFLLPVYFGVALAENTVLAQWVIFFLGASVAVRMAMGAASGLLTGYHRWDLHNSIHAGDSLLSIALMVLALYFTDLSITGMAIGYLISTIVFESLRVVCVKKICKEFTFNLKLASWVTCKDALIFGIKTMLSHVPPIILLQAISIMLVSSIGPSALAVFARPVALTKQVKVFMTKFTFMLSPTAGSMQGQGDIKAIQALFLSTTKLSFAFALPSLIFLAIYGDVILHYWMGAEYAIEALIMILAFGQLLPMGQDTSLRILTGMNQHGIISLFAFIAIFVLFVVELLFVGIGNWELTTAALLFVIPMNIVYGVIIPIYTCRELKLPLWGYVYNSFIKPLFYITPFITLLAWSRHAYQLNEFILASVFFAAAGFVTIIIYFIYLVPKVMQQKFLCRLKFQSSCL